MVSLWGYDEAMASLARQNITTHGFAPMRIAVKTLVSGRLSVVALNSADRLLKATPLLAGLVLAVYAGSQLVTLLSPTTHGYRALPVPAPAEQAGSVAQAHWFGVEPVAQLDAPPPLTVIGVYAPQGNAPGGFAIVDENGHSTPLLQGKSTAGGWTLRRVEASGIVVTQGGQERFVPLIARSGANPAAVTPAGVDPAGMPGAPAMMPRQIQPGTAQAPRDIPGDQVPADPAQQK